MQYLGSEADFYSLHLFSSDVHQWANPFPLCPSYFLLPDNVLNFSCQGRDNCQNYRYSTVHDCHLELIIICSSPFIISIHPVSNTGELQAPFHQTAPGRRGRRHTWLTLWLLQGRQGSCEWWSHWRSFLPPPALSRPPPPHANHATFVQ